MLGRVLQDQLAGRAYRVPRQPHGLQRADHRQQTLGGLTKPPRLLVFTSGVLANGGSPSDAAHGGAWGFARVLRLEHPALRAQNADVSCVPSVIASPAFLGSTTEAEAAWRGDGHHYIARLRVSSAALESNTPLAGGLFAITGGLGGLGLRAASLLVEGGASGVVLSSRSGRMSTSMVDTDRSAAMRATACDVGDAADALGARRVSR